jgi:hypothetical protein
MNIATVREDLTAARARGDLSAITALYFQLPLSERNQPITAAGRGHSLPPVRVVGASHKASGAPWGSAADSRFVGSDHKPLVMFSQRAIAAIRDMRHGAEDGGWLIGPRNQSARAIETTASIFRADSEDREPNSLLVHYSEIAEINEARGPRECVVGHFHTQPLSSNPSAQDIRMWATALEYLEQDWFAGVVVRERLTGAMDLQAFVFSKENGATVHRSATIHVRS